MHTFFHGALLRYAKTNAKMPLLINQYLTDYIKLVQHQKVKDTYTSKMKGKSDHTTVRVICLPVLPSLFPV